MAKKNYKNLYQNLMVSLPIFSSTLSPVKKVYILRSQKG